MTLGTETSYGVVITIGLAWPALIAIGGFALAWRQGRLRRGAIGRRAWVGLGLGMLFGLLLAGYPIVTFVLPAWFVVRVRGRATAKLIAAAGCMVLTVLGLREVDAFCERDPGCIPLDVLTVWGPAIALSGVLIVSVGMDFVRSRRDSRYVSRAPSRSVIDPSAQESE